MSDKALLLGINEYESISDLRGCRNDVRDMRRLLTEAYGFNDSNVRPYFDEAVTKRAVNDGFTWLLQDARPGDRLVFHYSGHGSYVPSKDNDEDIDELICLYDMNWDNPETYLIDDDLGKLASRVPPGVFLTVVLDSCHSGTGTRVLGPRATPKQPLIIMAATAMQLTGTASREMVRRLSDDAELKKVAQQEEEKLVLARFVERPKDRAVRERRRRVKRLGASLQARAAQLNHELLAAATETQTAADAMIDGEFHGAFTHYLCLAARQLGTASTTHNVMQHAQKAIREAGYTQTPQSEGPFANESLFGRATALATGGSATVSPTQPVPPGESMPQKPAEPDPSILPGLEGKLDIAGGSAIVGQMLRVAEKFLDLADRLVVAVPPPRVAITAARVANAYVVYVHGITRYQPGYSIPWWAAMSPYLTAPLPQRKEVVWSNVVNPRGLLVAPVPVPLTPAEEAVKQQIKEIVADRLAQLPVPPSTRGERAAVGERDLGLSDVIGIDDFLRYMFNSGEREQILACFFEIVEPLLRDGATLEIISHSWGTVVAYEGLRRLEAKQLPGRVADLFVVGSALSIGPVQINLFSRVGDGRRPAMVDNFINLDAIGDPVGGRISGVFDVTEPEFLNLPAVGCATFPFTNIPINPSCAHSSYFDSGNVRVNRDIFALNINV